MGCTMGGITINEYFKNPNLYPNIIVKQKLFNKIFHKDIFEVYTYYK